MPLGLSPLINSRLGGLMGASQGKAMLRAIDWSDLAELYQEQELSIKEIAGMKGCCLATVSSALRRYGIPKRPQWSKDSVSGRCFACGICVGPQYNEHESYPVGDKKVCGWCYRKLKKDGFIELPRSGRLLPDGTVED